jgi:hypothetical protein
MKKIFDGIFFYLLLAILLFPAFNGVAHLLEEKKLDGAVEIHPDSSFSKRSWFSGEWQKIKEDYLNDVFYGHNFCLRLHNEIDFRLFHKGHARKLILGKDNYLFERDYILTYLGKDYLGDNVIQDYTNKIKRAQDYLASKGKTLVVVLAAGKGSFYPEYFPEPYSLMNKSKSNFEEFANSSDKIGLNFIDYSSYFRSMKNSSPYLLYPRYGTHWSIYGMNLVADSLIRYIEVKRNVHLPHIVRTGLEMKQAQDMDYDIGSGMNLLCYLNGPEMAYPQMYFESKEGKDSVKLLVISDSFYMGLFYMGFGNSFQKEDFWYYNHQVFPEIQNGPKSTDELNFEDQISNHDVIILMATEHNIPGVGWGFVDKVLDMEAKEKGGI